MIQKILIPIIVFIVSFILTAPTFKTYCPQQQFKYVGVDKCVSACHKSESQGRQLDIWKESKHSKAFFTLQTPEADSIAKSQGYTTPAAETPKCLKCHILGKDINPDELGETFDKTQGVQCETCHGPGSAYKTLSIMKDKQKATENGLITHTDKEAFCTGCHNTESPKYKEFIYDEMWEKIKHPKPKN